VGASGEGEGVCIWNMYVSLVKGLAESGVMI